MGNGCTISNLSQTELVIADLGITCGARSGLIEIGTGHGPAVEIA
jgi:hypothetical protein